MARKESILKKKTESFAVRIIRLYQYLVNQQKETIMSKQVYRSGTSIGANVAESNAQSDADFISKLSIALKEANETEYWIRNLYSANLIDNARYISLQKDNEEIIKLLVSSIKTMKRKTNCI